LLSIHVRANAHDFAIANRLDRPRVGLHDNAAFSAFRDFMVEHHYLVTAGVDVPVRTHLHPLPDSEVVHERLYDLGMPSIDPTFVNAADRRVPFDLRIERRERRFHISTQEGFVRGSHDLHVLLRHRPPSIPRPSREGGIWLAEAVSATAIDGSQPLFSGADFPPTFPQHSENEDRICGA
jgi:hypothetical protein